MFPLQAGAQEGHLETSQQGCSTCQDHEQECIPSQCSEKECSLCQCSCEGLTPGYWKNHVSEWEFYSPDTRLGDVFGVPVSLGMSDYTLLEALNFDGGPELTGMARNMFRHAVAALLNSSSSVVNYPYKTDKVIYHVNQVNWNSRSHVETLKDTFEAFNQLGVQS